MKRFILLMFIIILLTGCVNVNNSDINTLINEAITSNEKIYNTYRTGYKFYLPHGMNIDNSKEYNEEIRSKDYTFYLYIDLISYLNKSKSAYEKSNQSYFSSTINNNDKFGYVEINKKENKYLVEIMYNYAKIEVMVDEKDINDSVCKSIIILSSIYYNDDILANLSSDTVLSYSDEMVDIFKTNGSANSNFIEYVEEFDDVSDNYLPDYDVIN